MTRRYSLLSTLLALLLLAISSPSRAQDLHVNITASSDLASPGDGIDYTVRVSNTGAVDLADVAVVLDLPDHIQRFDSHGDLSCSWHCDAAERTTWTVNTLGPGESRALFYRAFVQSDAEGIIETEATASATNASDVIVAHEVVVQAAPLLRLSLAPDLVPAPSGEPFTFTLTYGNVGTANPTDVVLRMPVPEGTSFVSATGGGTLQDGVVTWPLGTVGVGQGGQVRVTLEPDPALAAGTLIEVEAAVDAGLASAPVVRSATAVPVGGSSPLHVSYTLSRTTLGPSDLLDVEMMVSNTGPVDLTDAVVTLRLPNHTSRFDSQGRLSCTWQCDANERVRWEVGTLAPGESRTLAYRTSLQDQAPQGEVLRTRIYAAAPGVPQMATGVDLHVDPSPLLRLDLRADARPVDAGKPYAYTLTYGNVGTANPTDVVLRMPVPEGTSFVSATGGGTLQDGVVTWPLGIVGVGASGELRLIVAPDPTLIAGTLIEARATLDAGVSTEPTLRATTTVPIGSTAPLHASYALSQRTLGPGRSLDVEILASNTGPVDLTDVVVWVRLPDRITRFDSQGRLSCTWQCDANERVRWEVGTLAPGESRTLAYRTSLQSQAGQGELFRTHLEASSPTTGQLLRTRAVAADPTPLLTASLVPMTAPVQPGEAFTFTLTVGNVGAANPTDVVLRMPVPEGTSFVSATGGGTLQDGVVTWPLGTVGVGQGAQVQLTVEPDAGLAAGVLLDAEATLDPSLATESVLRSMAAVPVGSASPLSITYTLDRRSVEPAEEIDVEMTATNNGVVDLAEVEVRLQLPGRMNRFDSQGDLSCTWQCDANERPLWAIGTLEPGATSRVTFTLSMPTNAPRGDLLRTYVEASALGARQQMTHRDALLGTLINIAPSSAVVTSPEDGARFLIGGADGEEPISPDSAFVVTWDPATDPEGDPITYTWQLSTSEDFGSLLVSAEVARATLQYETDFGTLASLLADNGVGVGDSLTLYHRVVASDGTNGTPSAAFSIVLTRGTIVSSDGGAGLPTAFVLHGNYPNPFGHATTFAFDLPEPAHVALRVFDMLGREVRTVLAEHLPAGAFQHAWSADGLAAGLYVYRLEAGDFTATDKLVVLR